MITLQEAAKILGASPPISVRQLGKKVGLTSPISIRQIIEIASQHQLTVKVLGGEPFFTAKGNELPIDGPVFPRGRGQGPSIYVQTNCGKKVNLSILDPSGKVIANPLLNQQGNDLVATWPWTSNTGWAVPSGIPVGKYTIIASISGFPSDVKVPFYIIFNPNDIAGPQRFSFDDTAVWFGTGLNSIRGLHYFLHQSDYRVFSFAINAANGKTDSYDAAIAIARAEEKMFVYSLSYHTNDVVDLIVNFKEAQCADDACCLTAFLRAVGIPAHPVTADAALETGAANWTFDTWVEFLAPHDGVIEWRIIHPHQYKGMQPESRGTFGSTRSVAQEISNDLIVMANENWILGQLDDGSNDVTYGRNNCNEPNQQISKANWIDELCEQGYWTKPHWNCQGIPSYGLRASLNARDGFRTHDLKLTLNKNNEITGTIDVVNPFRERRSGNFAIELVAYSPMSSKFPETSFGKIEVPIILAPGEPLTVPFNFRLPETLAPEKELVLWSHLDEHTIALQEVQIPPRMSYEVILPEHYAVGEEGTIRAVLSNTSSESVRNVDVEIMVPYALQVEQIHQRFEEIKPNESQEVSWPVRAIAQLRSGSIHISAASANGGSVISRHPFTVAGSKKA
jgi:hypothetical protein